MAYVEAIVLEMAARETVVLVGRASTTILGKIPQALRVANQRFPRASVRSESTSSRGSPRTRPIDYVRRSDRERAARVSFLYHVDWDNPFSYDLVINTERLSADEGARLICQALQEKRVEITPTARQTIRDLSLAAQAKAALLANPMTRLRQYLRHLHRRAPRSERKRPHRRGAPSGAEEWLASRPGVTGVLNDIVVLPGSLSKVQRWIEPTTQKAVRRQREAGGTLASCMRRAVLGPLEPSEERPRRRRGA